MAEDKQFPPPESSQEMEPDSGTPPKTRPQITRRDFLVRSNAGAVAVGVMSGAGFAAGLVQAEPPQVARPSAAAGPGTTRRVTVDIDGKKYQVNVDVRESLWETMNYQLGLSNCNLGCDRAKCGACTVLVDGKAVNGCSVLSARLGRGQKILTVAGLPKGPGVAGLHPVQRAFCGWGGGLGGGGSARVGVCGGGGA